jgi:hypothetical protein
MENPMAFSVRNLSVLAYANGFTLWHYKAMAEAASDLNAPGFFADAGDMLAGGDMMMVSTREGGRLFSIVADGPGLQAIPLS